MNSPQQKVQNLPPDETKKTLTLRQRLQQSLDRGRRVALTPIQKFVLFLNNHSVIPLAFGVIIADMVKQFVGVIVDGLIRPFIGLFIPGGNKQFAPLNVEINGAVFKFGDVLSVILQTFIIFVILYVVLGWLLKKEDLLGTIDTKENLKKKR